METFAARWSDERRLPPPDRTAQEAMRVAVGATGDAKRRSPGGPLSVALADFRHAGENL